MRVGMFFFILFCMHVIQPSMMAMEEAELDHIYDTLDASYDTLDARSFGCKPTQDFDEERLVGRLSVSSSYSNADNDNNDSQMTKSDSFFTVKSGLDEITIVDHQSSYFPIDGDTQAIGLTVRCCAFVGVLACLAATIFILHRAL